MQNVIANCKIQHPKSERFNKIKDLTTNKDNSAELKRGEIKDILIKTAKEMLPDFDFLTYKNSCYTFQRLRKTNDLTVY